MGRRARDPGRGLWVPPGGKVRLFETLAQTAVRELKEETGLNVVVTQVGNAGVFELIDEPAGVHCVVVYSTAVLAEDPGVKAPGDDLDAVRFFTRAELADLPLVFTSEQALVANGWL